MPKCPVLGVLQPSDSALRESVRLNDVDVLGYNLTEMSMMSLLQATRLYIPLKTRFLGVRPFIERTATWGARIVRLGIMIERARIV
jgi:hypothetical protein